MYWLDSIQEKVVKRGFQCMTRTIMSIIIKLYALIQNAHVECLRRQTNVYPSNILGSEPEPQNQLSVGAEAVNEENMVFPCVQRLQRLEFLLEELNKKPAEIPPEKDQLLQRSLERIKSVEFDLEKTKRVIVHFICLTFIKKIMPNKWSKSCVFLGIEFYSDEAVGDFRVTGSYEGVKISCKLFSSPVQVVPFESFLYFYVNFIYYSLHFMLPSRISIHML